MISRYEVTLNGISLSSLHPSILITDVSYSEPSYDLETFTSAKRHGARIYRVYKEVAKCVVTFAIRAYDIQDRQKICQKICAWAKNGGDLRINDRENQKLQCVCENLPSIGSVLKWTDYLKISFSAYALPYWQEINPSTLTLTGTDESGTLFVPGSASETMVEATITANAAISDGTITLTVGDRTLQLTGITLAQDATIVISYDDEMIQSIKRGTTSLLANRSGADDLIAECGRNNTVSFTTSASCDVEFRARGCWE